MNYYYVLASEVANMYLVLGVGVDEGLNHLPRLHKQVGHMDHERLAQPLRVVALQDLYGRDVGANVAVGVPPPL